VTVQAAALKSLVAHPEDLLGRVVRPGPALSLLDGYLRSLTSLEEPPSSELASTIGVHLLDLVAPTLGPTAEAASIVRDRGVKAARLRAILAEVARRFSDASIAANVNDTCVFSLFAARFGCHHPRERTGGLPCAGLSRSGRCLLRGR
jgi:hypothetical protein